jgi:phytoene dehydrogenase-like protein
MCDQAKAAERTAVERAAGRMSFVESISVLDCTPQQLGHRQTIVFYNDSPTFHWQRCEDLCDVRTGVICSPNNFLYGDSDQSDRHLPEGVMRITTIANYEGWSGLDVESYTREKLRWYDRSVESAVRFVPDFRRHVIDTDVFTPRTIERFTWHQGGTVYGAPQKQLDGRTHLSNLYICGTDQGFVGIIGAIISGISMANQHCLREAGGTEDLGHPSQA